MKRIFVMCQILMLSLSIFYTPSASTSDVDALDRSIREVSAYLGGRINSGDKVAFVTARNTFPALTEYVINRLIENAVNARTFQVVDRAQFDAIRAEMEFQMSGDVSDSTVRSIGRILGAKSIITVTISQAGNIYMLGVRALDVESAIVQGQVNKNITRGPTIDALAGAPAPAAATPTSTQTRTATTTAAQTAASSNAEPPIQGTMVPGNSLSEKLAWLQRSADSHNTYIIEVNADERIAPYTFEYRGAINITVVLRGDRQNRTIRLNSNDKMFTVRPNVTFVLDNNITLHGHNGNNATVVHLDGGTFKMRTGSTITGNVIVSNNWTGGGVGINSGTFEMSGGTISGNTVARNGGGVGMFGGTFTMTGGTISGNTANSRGGGVNVQGGTFTMRGGIIAGNTAREYAGGVNFGNGTFNKTGGTITGHNSDQNNGNVVRDADGNIFARRGHAVFVNENTRKETTAGTGANLSAGSGRPSGAWDQ